jgi:GAF domain-containing protein
VSAAPDRPVGDPSQPSGTSGERAADTARLRELLAVAESAIEALKVRCEDLEEDKAHLGRLCVASVQLHEAAGGEAESLRNLQDVLVNLIGSEQLAIWSLSTDGRRLDLRASQSVDTGRWQTVRVGEGPVGRAAATGEIVVERPDGPGQPTLAIPLLLGRRVVGVVAVFDLLAHRSGFAPRDQDVFRLISQQAAFALCCSDGAFGMTRRRVDG